MRSGSGGRFACVTLLSAIGGAGAVGPLRSAAVGGDAGSRVRARCRRWRLLGWREGVRSTVVVGWGLGGMVLGGGFVVAVPAGTVRFAGKGVREDCDGPMFTGWARSGLARFVVFRGRGGRQSGTEPPWCGTGQAAASEYRSGVGTAAGGVTRWPVCRISDGSVSERLPRQRSRTREERSPGPACAGFRVP